MTKLRPLTPEEHATLQAYALENGRHWKTKLREDWMNARTTGILQALRNSHGPSWLVSYSLPKRSPPSEGLTRVNTVTADNGDTRLQRKGTTRRGNPIGPAAKIAP